MALTLPVSGYSPAELQKELQKSKRRVLIDVLCARAIQKSLLSSSLSTYGDQRLTRQNVSPFAKGAISSTREDIQGWLDHFQPASLLEELQSIAKTTLLRMNRDLFCRIALMASRGCLDRKSSLAIYDELLSNNTQVVDERCGVSEDEWASLVKRLIYRLRLVFLAEKLSQNKLYQPSTVKVKEVYKEKDLLLPDKRAHGVVGRVVGPLPLLGQGSIKSMEKRIRSLRRKQAASTASLSDLVGSQSLVMSSAAQSVKVSGQYSSAASFSRSISLLKMQVRTLESIA